MSVLNAGAIVKLINDDPPYFKSGDAGIVWGIYGFPASLYEATFCNHTGYEADRMFDEDEVEKVSVVTQVYLTENLLEFTRQLTQGQ